MASNLLSEVISGSIAWHDFVFWLKPKYEEDQDINFKVDCNQGDFVIYFVNLLRDEVSSILQKASEVNYSVKKTTSFSLPDNKKKCGRNERLPTTCTPSEHVSHHGSKQATVLAGSNLNKNCFMNTNTNKDDNTVFNKSVTGSNKHFIKCNVLNGAVKSGTDHQYNATRVKIGVTNSAMHPSEKSSEATFLHNCHLSPIATELYSSTKAKYSGFVSETDSPNNRLMRRDSRPGSGKRLSLERVTSSPQPSFSIAEHSFPAIGSPAKQNVSRRRRIKPTRLADTFEKGRSPDQNKVPNFGEVVRPLEPSVPFRDDVIKEKVENLETDFRDLLRLEKQKLQQNVWSNTMTSKSSQPALIVNASPETVKFKEELSTLAKIYNLLLDANLICNIVTEIHFIFSLLNVQEGPDVCCPEIKEHASFGFFLSVHECVFFATAVLNAQRFFLSTFDKASLKLLLNNERISLFVPDLWQYLYDLHLHRRDIRNFVGSSAFHASVCFQSDTDNRENFPSDRTFVTFRKQRDAFYEILGLWEENHSSPGWSFGVALGTRVRNLLCMNDEPANFIHFARLFRTQLLGSYWKTSNASVEEDPSDALSEVLKCLKEGNPDKYSRLYERLVTPVKSSNSCSLTEFPEQQEFYKEFIVYGNHAIFNTHLIDSLWHQIEHLNSSDFSASDMEEGSMVDKDTKQAFVTCVSNLQLLAKFLGFVLFLPYRSKSKMSSSLVEKQSSVRHKLRAPIDVLSCVQEAIQCKKLTLTVPWVTHFLAMVDCVSCNLPYYREVISLLCAIYRTLPSISNQSPYGSFMLKVCLGWLFERPQLPEDIFYAWWMNGSQNCDYAVNTANSRNKVAGIDELDLIEWDTLITLCPNLESIKCLLVSDTNNLRNVMPPRHITPVLVATEQASASSSTRSIEHQLEENFLEGQPSSIRKTIEFVSDRIASSCVKFICSRPLTEVKQKALKTFETSLDSDNKTISTAKLPLETSLLALELKRYCQSIIPKLCYDKCEGTMPLLLAEDVPEAVTQTCVQIAVRLSLERVNVWINSNITPALFTKHLSSEMDKVSRNSVKPIKSSHVLPHGWRDLSEKDALSPAESISIIRNTICLVMRDSEVSGDDIVSVLSTILDTLQSRRDLIPSAERVLGALSVDLVFALVAHHPELIKESILKKFLNIWTTKEVVTSHCFLHLICPRNIMILNNSEKGKKVWSTAAYFLCFVLKNNIVPPNEFESQCVAIFRHEWPLETLKHLAGCFEEVVKQYQSGNCDANFVLLLELVSDLCREMDNEDF